MTRPLRIEYDGALYHVTSRGNERRTIFKDDADRELFLERLAEVTERYQWICHAYCLMDNHYHLVVETPDGNLSKGMRHLNGVYTQSFNKTHRRVGHLFQGRFKGILVQKDSYFLEVCRYVVLNPVRAKAAKEPQQWQWSSYRATVGMVEPHPCLRVEEVLSRLDSRKSRAQQRYREFVYGGIEKPSIWDGLKGQTLLGEERFVEGLIGYVKGKKEIQEIPKGQRYLGRPSLEKLFRGVPKRKAVRDKLIVDAVKTYGYSQQELASVLGLHYSTISRLLKEFSEHQK